MLLDKNILDGSDWPSISIVTPSYNQGPFIERTILSVLDQNIPGLEYVVIDGCSQDDTVKILTCYEDRIHWISEPDKGQADAVNKGIRISHGEIIGWLNSDDIYYDGVLAIILEFFSAHPEVDILYGNAHHIDTDDKIIEPYYTEDWDYERLKDICYICQPSVFFRRSLVEKIGVLDDRLQYCMDYEYWLRIGRKTPFVHMDRFLAGSRMYFANKTMGSRIAVHREINDMLKKTLGAVPVKWIYGYANVVLEERGFDCANPEENLKIAVLRVYQTLYAFWGWKRKIPLRECKTMVRWLVGPIKNAIHQFG